MRALKKKKTFQKNTSQYEAAIVRIGILNCQPVYGLDSLGRWDRIRGVCEALSGQVPDNIAACGIAGKSVQQVARGAFLSLRFSNLSNFSGEGSS